MKRFFVITCLVACFGYFLSTNANTNNPTPKIALKGKLTDISPLRNLPPLEAYQNAFGVLVVFNTDLGYLDIEVIDETGETAFLQNVNATAGNSLIIYTDKWESGEYILLITDGLGGSLEGEFVIE